MAVATDAPPVESILAAVPTQLYINGKWQDAASGERFAVVAPFSEETLTEVAAAGQADVDAAVAAARAQVDGGEWSRLTGAERRDLLLKLADLVERDQDALCVLESLDVGKPAEDPHHVDLPNTIDTLRYFAGWADKIDGRSVKAAPHMGHARHSYTIREPVGVIAAIVPWNSPLMIASWKLGPALAAGNAVVLKPSEDAPLSQLHLAKLIEEAGFPAGVVSVLPGYGAAAGAPLAAHPGVDKVSFTGSPEVGRAIAVQCAGDFRGCSLELGGKSPQIILADADLKAAIAGTATGMFANAGEICAAGTRVLVHRSLYDDVVSGLAEAAGKVHLGDPFDAETTMGALINAAQLERVTGYVEKGKAEGARVVTGGGRPDRPGYFVEPTVFADGNNDMTIAREEIFGPVGLVMAFDDPVEAARLANDTRYGLAAFIWTRDVSAAHELAAEVKAGTVWVNGFGAPDARLPWGGMKTSGMGRELSYSAIEENTEEKTVTIVL
jgi:acyl-CoA reductase-like NAD-dependent aldehyde dehydrogenase